MVFLFVGSSALTEASFPRDLAIPQLLLSSACAIVLTMKASPTAMFPHRGLAPHQFTPMSGAHQALHRTAICASGLPCGFCFICQFVAVGELGRSLRREVASTTAERGLFLTQPCLSRQVFYGSRRLAGGASLCQGSGASQTM